MAFLDIGEEELSDFVKRYYQDFFAKNGFALSKKDASAFVYTNPSMQVKIINKQKKFTLELAAPLGNNFWDLEILLAYFKFVDYRISESDVANRKNVLLKTLNREDYSGHVNLLNMNFKRITKDFSAAVVQETTAELNKLVKEKQQYQS